MLREPLTCELLSDLRTVLPGHYHRVTLLVGGAVRDLLLGKPVADIDLLCCLSADALVAQGFHRITGRTGNEVYVRNYAGVGRVEVSLLSAWSDLPSELQRRDFTVNAMALDLSGRLYDPLHGLMDLAARSLRPCHESIFSEDPARIFRAFRFFVDGWQAHPALLALLNEERELAAVRQLPVERFSNEMLKALAGAAPASFFQSLVQYRGSDWFLPELARMATIPAGPLQYHPEGDLLSHALQVLERMSQQSDLPLARFCALFHDLGKLNSDAHLFPRHPGHEEAGARLSVPLGARLRLPSHYRKALYATCLLHGKVNRWAELKIATRLHVASQALKGGIAGFLPALSLADKPRSDSLTGWNDALVIAQLPVAELGIEPRQLMALDAGQRGGYIWQKRVEALAARLI